MHVERIEPGTHSRAGIQSWSIHPPIRAREAAASAIMVGDRLGVYRADAPYQQLRFGPTARGRTGSQQLPLLSHHIDATRY